MHTGPRRRATGGHQHQNILRRVDADRQLTQQIAAEDGINPMLHPGRHRRKVNNSSSPVQAKLAGSFNRYALCYPEGAFPRAGARCFVGSAYGQTDTTRKGRIKCCMAKAIIEQYCRWYTVDLKSLLFLCGTVAA